jgi:hypothetical protein
MYLLKSRRLTGLYDFIYFFIFYTLLNTLFNFHLFKGNAIRIEKKNLEEKSNSYRDDKKYSSGVAYAKGRINSARNKLIGINPCVIVRNDLLSGIHKKSQYLEYYINVATGRNERDKNSKLIYKRSEWLEKGENCRLSVEDQVKCIIEQSVDSNILGRTWVGWEPFI